MRGRIVFGLAAALALTSCVRKVPTPESEQERHDLPVSMEDVQILELADQLLSSELLWNRVDTRECSPQATQFSLFCALHEACVQVLGKYEHRRAALQEVRF